ncbi:hypothetical protein P152DRAFT_454172 [Eremomyces bilateralis CBS 781.70]|uniref:Bromo domain-containing protein n=1 Tax=Eremomyces bilateralis CBS 781.70 TaxID=1392243 RepID=A0A6G1GHM0_9PEZI|nr:uncharacterized protein P152DRAFT_454172 [Eremomyces bilateralis CBS 781.70]KAF1817595.1 hypothetical protein P152DRAFT_454172 [Eremomyces bilateralis CBS 781.70]
MTEFESDVKRMILNAKAFYHKASLQYADAERVRKTASNFMTRYNPAYRSGNYVAQATPIPDSILAAVNSLGAPQAPLTPTPTPSQAPQQQTVSPAPPKQTNGVKSETPAETPAEVDETPDADQTAAEDMRTRSMSASRPEERAHERDASGKLNFAGMTFQRAQEMIMDEILHYEEPESGLAIYTPFVNLPSRQLVDYYQLIKTPISLKGVQKKVKGIQGRTTATGKTLLPTWDAFETEMSHIWKNARAYNEDGSDLYNLAGELEKHFRGLLDEAKLQVEGPSVKLKLNAPAKTSLKLRLGGAKASPGPRTKSETPGSSGEASKSAPQAPAVDPILERLQSSIQNPPDDSPSARDIAPDTGLTVFSRPTVPSSSDAAGQPTPPVPGFFADPSQPVANPEGRFPAPSLPIMPPMDPYAEFGFPRIDTSGREIFRKTDSQGKPLVRPIMPEILFSVHPHLHLEDPWIVSTKPDPHKREYYHSIQADPLEHFWHIRPHLPTFRNNPNSRILVTVNNVRLQEVDAPGCQPGNRDPEYPWFETRLIPGICNRIEVEALQGPVHIKPMQATPFEQLEWERSYLFIHLLRHPHTY